MPSACLLCRCCCGCRSPASAAPRGWLLPQQALAQAVPGHGGQDGGAALQGRVSTAGSAPTQGVATTCVPCPLGPLRWSPHPPLGRRQRVGRFSATRGTQIVPDAHRCSPCRLCIPAALGRVLWGAARAELAMDWPEKETIVALGLVYAISSPLLSKARHKPLPRPRASPISESRDRDATDTP